MGNEREGAYHSCGLERWWTTVLTGRRWRACETLRRQTRDAKTLRRYTICHSKSQFYVYIRSPQSYAQYLEWTKNADNTECGWCRYKTQTRDHLFKHRKERKPQQKILWAEVRRETGRGKDRFTIRDLFADERCTSAILDFLRTTKVGSRVGLSKAPPKPGETEEAEEKGAGGAE